jgi:excisionase family DNA binding protein
MMVQPDLDAFIRSLPPRVRVMLLTWSLPAPSTKTRGGEGEQGGQNGKTRTQKLARVVRALARRGYDPATIGEMIRAHPRSGIDIINDLDEKIFDIIAEHTRRAEVRARNAAARREHFITVPEAARLMGISRNAGYDACKRREWPHTKIGRRILIPADLKDRLLQEAYKRMEGK